MNPITAQLSSNLILLIQFFSLLAALLCTPNIGAYIFRAGIMVPYIQRLFWAFSLTVFIMLTFFSK